MSKKTEHKIAASRQSSLGDILGRIGLALIATLVGILSLKKIFFVTADLGRHLTNGRLLSFTNELMETNFYSYTQPNFPFMNHHWGSGFAFNEVFSAFGYSGLSIINALALTLAFSLLLYISQAASGRISTIISALICLPLITARTEVRPETFSYVFASFFYTLLWLIHLKKLSTKALYILPILMLIWVNLHIYFVLGYMLLGLYLLEGILRRQSSASLRDLILVSLLTFLASFCNPVGWKLAFYPLQIFRDYGYLVAENQSVIFFWTHPMPINGFASFHFVAALIIFSVLLKFKMRTTTPWSIYGFALLSLMLASLAIRNFSLFGLFSFPVLALTLGEIHSRQRRIIWLFVLSGGLLGTIIHGIKNWSSLVAQFGTGLYPGSNDAAEFFKENRIKGPIFNNYDIGGYLIFHLFPSERVFVDNRPEAYAGSFFRDLYGPMQEQEAAWRAALHKYDFNVIFFYRLDNTPAGQKFLVDRIRDPEWRAIYVDGYNIILARTNEANRWLIEKYGLPQEMFIVQ